MATDFWNRQLEKLGQQFSACEAVELAMIREAKPVSDASHKAYLADLLSDAAWMAKALGKSRIKGEMREECGVINWGDTKLGTFGFYAPAFLTMPYTESNRITKEMEALFKEAGGVLDVIPPAITRQLRPLGLALTDLTDRKIRWLACVFDLELKLKHTEQIYLQGQPRLGCWSATLVNVMSASATLINWLITADNPPIEPAKEWTDWRAPKVAMTWFPTINAPRSWSAFARRLRNEDLLKDHPISGFNLCSIHQSVFERRRLDFPLKVELIAHK